MQYMVDACPDTRMVLGGYSQGAAVIDVRGAVLRSAVGASAPASLPTLAERVAAVAVFGNPSDEARQSDHRAESARSAGKAIDLCNGDDPICSDGRERLAHSLYVSPGWPARRPISSPGGSRRYADNNVIVN